MFVLLAVALLLQQACAHMELVSPPPLRSPRDPAVSYSYKDYDMTSPLYADGSDFKCKRYQYSDTNPQAYDIKAVYQAGNTYNISLQGTATHSGGSCQISLSYDNGETFKVIKSIIGGCPLTLSYNFTIPTFAPSSNTVLLSWSWFNVIGNREMYQNCARVQITGAGSQRHRRQARTYAMKRQTSFADLPNMFACNIANGCRTIERREVVFPEPGSDIVYGRNEIAVEPGLGFVIDGTPQTSSTSSTGAVPTPSTTSLTPSTTPAFTTVPIAQTTSMSTFGLPSSSQIPLSATITPLVPLRNMSFTSLPEGSASGFVTSTISTISTISTSTVADTSSSVANASATMSSTSTLPTTQMTSTSSPPAFSASSSSSTFTSTVIPFTSPFTFPPLPPISSATTTPLPLSNPARSDPPSSSSTTTSTPTTLATSTFTPTSATAPSYSSLPSASTTTTTTTTQPAQSPSPLPLPCTPGLFTCDTPTTFSRCVTTASGLTSYIFFGSVASGTICVDGSFVRENQGACTPDGELLCDGENAFFLCDDGGLIRMGPTAAGTVCRGGIIVAA